MSIFFRFLNKLNPNEEKFNELVNKSFCGSFLTLSTRFLAFLTERFAPNSFILKNIDNIYLVLFCALILAIPYVQTVTLGVITAALIMLSLINAIFKHKRFEFSTIHVPVFAFLAITILSVGFSTLFIPSLKGFAKMIIYFGAYFSFFEFLKKNPQRIFPAIIVVALSCATELIFVLKQILFGVNALAGWQDMHVNAELLMNRVFGTLKPLNPNLLAGYLLATIPCVFVASIYGFIKSKFKTSLMFALFGLLALFATVKTGCRGAYIGLFFEIILFNYLFFASFKKYFSQKQNFKKILLIIFGIFCLGAILFVVSSPAILHRLESIFTFRGDSSNSYRVNVYMASIKMFLDNFWIGIGTGNTTFRLIYGLYMITGFDALGAYNIFLEMAVESGVFAPITFLWLIILSFSKAINKLYVLPIKYKLVIIACVSAIFAMLIHGFFDTIWYRPQLQLLFWLYIAILAVVTLKGFAYEQK